MEGQESESRLEKRVTEIGIPSYRRGFDMLIEYNLLNQFDKFCISKLEGFPHQITNVLTDGLVLDHTF